MFFSKAKNKLAGTFSKFSGRKDFLEAVCASAALVASADGDISEDEIKAANKAVSANPNLQAAFKPTEIERVMDNMLRRAQSGRTGRFGLFKEIEDVKSDADMSNNVYLAALDVAEADGNIGDQERAVLNQVAKTLGVSTSALNNV